MTSKTILDAATVTLAGTPRQVEFAQAVRPEVLRGLQDVAAGLLRRLSPEQGKYVTAAVESLAATADAGWWLDRRNSLLQPVLVAEARRLAIADGQGPK